MATRISTGAGSAFLLVCALIVFVGIPRRGDDYYFKQRGWIVLLRGIQGNLRILDRAKALLAVEQKKVTGDPVNWTELATYLKGGTLQPIRSETYSLNPMGSNSTAQLSVKLGTYAAGSVISAP
jgi:hypothetical protein